MLVGQVKGQSAPLSLPLSLTHGCGRAVHPFLIHRNHTALRSTSCRQSSLFETQQMHKFPSSVASDDGAINRFIVSAKLPEFDLFGLLENVV